MTRWNSSIQQIEASLGATIQSLQVSLWIEFDDAFYIERWKAMIEY